MWHRVYNRPRNDPGHWPLLLALLPVAAGIAYLCQWQPVEVWDIAASRDGVLVATISSSPRRTPHITIWDDRLERLRTQTLGKLDPYRICFSIDGRLLAVACQGGMLVVLDTETLSMRSQFACPDKTIRNLAFTPSSGGILTIDYLGKGRIYQTSDGAMVSETADIQSQQWSQSRCSTDGRWALIASAKKTISRTTAYEITGRQFTPRWSRKGINQHPVAISSRGFSVITQANRLELLDRSGDTLRSPPGFSMTFDNTGKRYVRRKPGKLELVDADTDSVIHQVDGLPPNYNEIIFQGANHVISRRSGVISRWHLPSGKVTSQRLQWITPAEIWYLVFVVVSAGALWGLAWVRCGLRSRWVYRPLFDVVFLNCIALSASLVRISWVRAHVSVRNIEVPSLLGMLGSVISLATVWLIMGRGRLAGRLPHFLIALAGGWACLLLSMEAELPLAAVIAAAVLIVTLSGTLLCVRKLGGRITSILEEQIDDTSEKQTMVRLRDILLATAAFGMMVAVGRFTFLSDVRIEILVLCLAQGAGLALFSVCILWIAMGNGCVWLRLTVLLASVALCVGNSFVLPINLPLWAPGFMTTVTVSFGLTAFVSLLVFRGHGYRVSRCRGPKARVV